MNKYNNSYFIYIANKLYYKIINKYIESKKPEEFNKFLKSQGLCTWCKRTHRKDSYFCSKKCEKCYENEKYQSFKHNNRCKEHKFDKLTYKNICWSCYKMSFESNKLKIGKSFLLRLNGFKIFPTLRTSTDSWNGDKIAFETSLVDNNIDWFVYVKFYVNKQGKIRPIVVGKSGSMNVNATGSDLNFSTDLKDGPSRQFIHHNKFTWLYSHVAIKKCKSEREAYQVEKKIMNRFDLLGS